MEEEENKASLTSDSSGIEGFANLLTYQEHRSVFFLT